MSSCSETYHFLLGAELAIPPEELQMGVEQETCQHVLLLMGPLQSTLTACIGSSLGLCQLVWK